MPYFPPQNATSIAGTPVDPSAKANGYVFAFNSAENKIIYQSVSSLSSTPSLDQVLTEGNYTNLIPFTGGLVVTGNINLQQNNLQYVNAMGFNSIVGATTIDTSQSFSGVSSNNTYTLSYPVSPSSNIQVYFTRSSGDPYPTDQTAPASGSQTFSGSGPNYSFAITAGSPVISLNTCPSGYNGMGVTYTGQITSSVLTSNLNFHSGSSIVDDNNGGMIFSDSNANTFGWSVYNYGGLLLNTGSLIFGFGNGGYIQFADGSQQYSAPEAPPLPQLQTILEDTGTDAGQNPITDLSYIGYGNGATIGDDGDDGIDFILQNSSFTGTGMNIAYNGLATFEAGITSANVIQCFVTGGPSFSGWDAFFSSVNISVGGSEGPNSGINFNSGQSVADDYSGGIVITDSIGGTMSYNITSGNGLNVAGCVTGDTAYFDYARLNGGTGWNFGTAMLSVANGSGIAADFEGEVDIGNGGYTDPSPGVVYDLKCGGTAHGMTCLGSINSNAGYLVNNTSIITSSGQFTGTVTGTLGTISGANLTSLNGSNITTGTVADARLTTNIPKLNGTNTFTGANTFTASTTCTGLLSINAGLSSTVSTKTVSYTVGTADSTILANSSSSITLTLPSASSNSGREYTLKTINSSAIVASASGNIDANSTYTLTALNKFVTVISDGSAWRVIGNN